MSVLVVGVSHKTAPVRVLERLMLDASGVDKLVHAVTGCEHVLEATVLATCNRVEIYADVDRFHGSVESVSRILCELAGEEPEDVVPHLYVHYDDGAVSHLFHVAAGLDSMVVGEGQILGQAREALRVGQESGTIGPSLNVLFQQALRVGKRAHAETDIDHAAPSLVALGIERATAEIGPVAGSRVLVVGAGSMAALSAATVSRLGAAELVVASRTEAHARRLAEQHGGRAVPLTEVQEVLADTDLLLSCTGATGVVLPLSVVAAARSAAVRPLAVVDLALPHDVDPAVAELPGVSLFDLSRLADEVNGVEDGDVVAVRSIVAQEITAFLAARSAATVTPTVVALRTMATGIVDAEMQRLATRLPDLDPLVRNEVEHALRRVADKLLHQPTVRVRELANETGAVSYAAALAELFSLDPDAVQAMTRAEGRAMTTTPDATTPTMSTLGRTLRVGTRRSALATTQSETVAAALREALGCEVELVEVTTEGDVSRAPLAVIGGTGVFVGALREALVRGEVDLAVHSLKDLPTTPDERIALAAVPVREDPRDALVARDGLTLGELPSTSRIGTGSPRRAAQLHALGLGFDVVAIRGNVDTRMRRVAAGDVDAVVLARAGIARLGRLDEVTEVLDPIFMLPAPGQGALAVECRVGDTQLVAAVAAALDDARTRAAVVAERSVLAALEAGCSAPVGAMAEIAEGDDGDELWLRAVALSQDGAVAIRRSAVGFPGQAAGVGRGLAEEMLEDGAATLIEEQTS